MVSALPLCLFAIAVTIVSSQTPTPADLDSLLEDPTPIADRRTFKHKKNVKFVPFLKKHKKFGGWLPHVFNKAEYTEVPIIHEPIVRPAWKVHRYHGIELKPIEVSEPIIESHAIEHDLPPPPPPSFAIPPPPPTNVLFYHEKPILPPVAPLPGPTPFIFPSLPAALPAPAIFSPAIPPKTVFPIVPAPPPPPPVLPTIPLKVAQPQPAVFTTVSIPQPALPAVPPLVPALPPPVPSIAPVKIPQPILPPISTPAPPPAISSVTVAPPPAPVLPSLPVKIPQPILPPISTPAPPVFSPVTVAPPLPSAFPVFPSFPNNLQSPPVVSSFTALPSVAAPLPFAAVPEPEFPYPPSDTPIPSYIKHDSLHDTPVTEEPIKIEHPEIEIEEHVKAPEHVLGAVKPDTGLLHKLKGWKAEKAQAAFNHFAHFKAKPVLHHSIPIAHPDKIPLPIPVTTTIAPPHPTAFPSIQFPAPIRPLPLAPAAPVYFPPNPHVVPQVKYESFPPNNIELPPPPPPPLFNSYGVPIPHDSYAAINRDSHDEAASEEEPNVVPPPPAFGEQRNQKQSEEIQNQQESAQDAIQNFQPQTIPQKSPIYVPEENQTVKEDAKTSQETQQASLNSDSEENYQTSQEAQDEETDPNLNNHRTY